MKSSPQASQFRIGAGLTRYALRATFRNKAGYFFSLIFPLVFVIAFGLLSNSGAALEIGVSPQLDRSNPVYQEVQRLSTGTEPQVKLVEGTEAELERKVQQNRLAGILAPAAGSPGGVALVTASSRPQAGTTAESLLRGITAELSLRDAGVAAPAHPLQRREVPGRPFRHIDFILPGQIGFSMLSLATFGVGYSLATLRRTLVIKRMMATMVSPLTFVLSICLSRSVQAVFQSIVLLAVGVGLFQFHLAQGWVSAVQLVFLAFLGIMAFLGFGILLSNLFRDDQTLPVVLNLFNLPQVLLAGVFFPIDGMPGWVQAIGNNLPLSYLNSAMRQVASDGASLLQVSPLLLGLFAWGVVAYLLAARTFVTE